MLHRREAAQLKPGDRFVRVDDPQTIWTVRRVVDLQNLPPHAELVGKAPKARMVLVSSVVLRDRRQYRPVKDPAPLPWSSRLARVLLPRCGWRSLLGI